MRQVTRSTVLAAYQKQTKLWEATKMEITNFDIFEDRVKSLLERWRRFKIEHPEQLDSNIIRSCMLEIDDDFTKKLMEE